ncbi:MAG: UDP-N-acetylmuramoyl-L-alanine--D-glutamate ligase [Tepidiphilus sp.]|nr:UDP-N-acetylmuramoyl-L-alanine--D-glutamate ligase [Tepidiphilus sp.]
MDLVLGLGSSGEAMVRWLAHRGVAVRAADTRGQPLAAAGLRALLPSDSMVLGRPFEEALLEGVERVWLSPGLSPELPLCREARARGIPVQGELALFHEAWQARGRPGRLVAVTGTNGKTTTTALTAHLLRHAGLDALAAGNIAPAILTAAREREEAGLPWPEVWVLEVSSFQLETAGSFVAHAAVVLNVTEDHLDRHGSLETYAALKARVYQGVETAVVVRDDALVREMACSAPRRVTVGSDAPPSEADFGVESGWFVHGRQRLAPRSALPLPGRHNEIDALAALALAEAMGVAPEVAIEGLVTFQGLPHRVETVAVRADGARFIDDSKGTNVGATIAALAGFDEPVILIAGGDGKGQSFAPLAQAARGRVRLALLIGRDAPALEAAFIQVGVPTRRCTSLPEAVEAADAAAQPGEAVLLSPACASLDMFRDYAHRAQVFLAAIRSLPDEGGRWPKR